MPITHEGTVRGAGGLNIFYRSWWPQGPSRASVVIVHGFNSHSAYYRWVAGHLAARGLAVYALDLRGRGRSEGERFYVRAFDDYVHDVERVMALVSADEPGLPVFLFGHCAGGVVACLYALEHQGELAGLICESFAFKVPAPDVALAVVKGLAHVAPHAHVLRLRHEDFSRDHAVVSAMNEDPLIADETQLTQTLAGMVRADERLEQAFPRFTLPLFILHGTLDKATKPDGSRQFYESAGSADKTLKLYDGGFHDLLNDVDRDTVMTDIVTWIDARLSL